MPGQTQTAVPLVWTDDQSGYQCPMCSLYVTISKRAWATCPRCPLIPATETAALLIRDANTGLDEDEITGVVKALDLLLNATARASEAESWAKELETQLEAVRKVVELANALHPDSFKTGQQHLPPAFREVDFRRAFEALASLMNDVEAVVGGDRT